jgi:hypothetical protein
MGEDDPKLIVQPVKHLAQVLFRRNRRQGIGHARSNDHAGVTLGIPGRRNVGARRPVHWNARRPPQGISENPDGSARSANVFHLPCRNPVVNGAAADANNFARFHDRESLAIHGRFLRMGVSLVGENPVPRLSARYKTLYRSHSPDRYPPFLCLGRNLSKYWRPWPIFLIFSSSTTSQRSDP